MQKSIIPHSKTNEWLEFINSLGMVNLPNARQIFLSADYSQIKDPGQRILFISGRGKTLSLEGNLIGAKLTLDEAQLLAENRNAQQGYSLKDEILAYVYFERAVFFHKYQEDFQGLSLYRAAKRMVSSSILEALVDYQLAARELEHGIGSSTREMHQWISYFQRENMQVMHVIAQRRLAKYFSNQDQLGEAERLLTQALALSIDYDLPFLAEQIKNAYAYVLYILGETQEARAIYLELLKGLEGKFIRSAILENLTLSHARDKEFEQAADYLGQAIEHSQKYDVLSRIPDECLYMGDLQKDQLQQPELATHYYKLGSQASLKMAEFGFSLTGDRLAVVDRFEQRPRTAYSLPDTLGKTQRSFAFTQGKTWRELNDIFQFYLLKNHLETGSNTNELPRKLGLKTSTYYAIRRRLGAQDYQFERNAGRVFGSELGQRDLAALKAYVNTFKELSWQQANQRFEQEVIEHLFKQVGYQKTRLAETLAISYPTVLQKTKSLKPR